jgi:hypothetical protein
VTRHNFHKLIISMVCIRNHLGGCTLYNELNLDAL